MKKERSVSRYSIILAVAIGYFLPILGLTFYGNSLFGYALGWDLFSVGITTALVGTLFLYWMISKWNYTNAPTTHVKIENTPEEPAHTIQEPQVQVQDSAILHELEHYKEENQALTEKLSLIDTENQSLKQQCEQIHAEFDAFKSTAHIHLEQQQHHIRELQDSVADQKTVTEKKQQVVGILETKVNDLTYEIKTLLKLAESHVSSITNTYNTPHSHEETAPQPTEKPPIQPQDFQIQTTEEASQQLRKCIDIAQKITGSHRFGGQLHSLIDSPIDSFTLDLRRLCDTLRSENSACILLYSPKESQLIFANNQIKSLTGWSPEKFTQAFFEIVQNTHEWKQSLASLSMRSEAQLNLSLKTKWGHEIAVHGQVGMIPTGIFRHHAIAVLYI
jgi:hypothetical protein